MLKSKMYFHYLQMKSEVIDGHIVIKELPPKPELDSFELALLKKH